MLKLLTMVKNKRKITWHKKKGRFIPSAFMKTQEAKKEGNARAEPPSDAKKDRVKNFYKNLKDQIKKGLNEGP